MANEMPTNVWTLLINEFVCTFFIQFLYIIFTETSLSRWIRIDNHFNGLRFAYCHQWRLPCVDVLGAKKKWTITGVEWLRINETRHNSFHLTGLRFRYACSIRSKICKTPDLTSIFAMLRFIIGFGWVGRLFKLLVIFQITFQSNPYAVLSIKHRRLFIRTANVSYLLKRKPPVNTSERAFGYLHVARNLSCFLRWATRWRADI